MAKVLYRIGKFIALVLLLIVLIQILIVLHKDCKNMNVQDKDFNLGTCITSLISLVIPTEVSIAQFFSSIPLLLLTILILYWKYVAPHEK